MNSGWNISLFHYRNYGSEYGRVLMGIQVPEQDGGRFQEVLDETENLKQNVNLDGLEQDVSAATKVDVDVNLDLETKDFQINDPNKN